MLALWRPRRLQLTWLAPAALCVMGLPGLAPQPAESHARRPAAHAQVERVEPTPLAATASAKPSAPQPSLEPRRDSAHRTPRAASARAVSKPVVVEPAPVLDTSSSTVATPTVLAFSSYHTGVEELRPRVLPELALARDTRGPSLPRIVMRGPRPATLMR